MNAKRLFLFFTLLIFLFVRSDDSSDTSGNNGNNNGGNNNGGNTGGNDDTKDETNYYFSDSEMIPIWFSKILGSRYQN